METAVGPLPDERVADGAVAIGGVQDRPVAVERAPGQAIHAPRKVQRLLLGAKVRKKIHHYSTNFFVS